MTDPIRESEASAATPRWVKVFGIVAVVVVLLFVVLMFAGSGRHGPRRHLPGGDAGVQTPPEGARR